MNTRPPLRQRRLMIESPLGPLMLIADDVGLTNIYFPNEQDSPRWKRSMPLVEARDDDVPVEAARQLGEYFAGDRQRFDLPLHLMGNTFELDVWQAMRSIPYGETISYGEQAELSGHPGAFQAVGAANGRNPIPLVIPCHRVIGSDGSLTGFGGGIDVKRQLLDLESGVQRLPF